MKKICISIAGVILAGIVVIKVYHYIDFKRHIIGGADGPTAIYVID